ncbi:methyltransferase, FkbM family [Luteibacter sp. UNCMF331Sha3.1]|nr:methyltransferase, FkbM family [Luteibacter sp. UNCMF331Sha3.1]
MVRVEGISQPFLLPLSHQLPAYRARHRLYDRMLRDLADYIRGEGGLRMVDVGANVGDSILSTAPVPSDTFLAFEPHPSFIPYLQANTAQIAGVTLSDAACGPGEGSVQIRTAARGTAGTTVGEAMERVASLTSLDSALERLWPGVAPNFVKIDTDGFDVDVLVGGRRLWREMHPWLLYEMDPSLTRGHINRHLDGLAFLREAGYESAAAFTNTGQFDTRVDLADRESWEALMGGHSKVGPVHYHDVLLAPSENDLTSFLELLTQRRDPGAVTPASA